jgi:hypothetical protein
MVDDKSQQQQREMVILRSSEGREFTLPMTAAKLAELVNDSLPEDDDDDDCGATTAEFKKVDLIRVSGDCLAKVVEFMQHYDEDPMKDIPTPLGGTSFDEVRTVCGTQRSK